MFCLKTFSQHPVSRCLEISVCKTSWYKFCPNICYKTTAFTFSTRNLVSFHKQSAETVYKRNFKSNTYVFVRTNQNRTHAPGLSPKGRQRLTWATYLSCFTGAVLLLAIGLRAYKNFRLTARGMEPIEPEIGITSRRVNLYRYRGYVIPKIVADIMDNIFSFKVREDDIWIVTYPKAGTTWLTEIVYLLENDLNYDKAKSQKIDERIPFFEYLVPGLRTISKMPSPRIIKTHLPFSLLPREMKEKKPKIIYLARNPKDTIVSFYHFTKSLAKLEYRGDFNHFFNTFINGTMKYGPWWKHVKEGWQWKDEDNVLFLTYEEMKKDLPGTIRTVSNFLGKHVNEVEVQKLAVHTSFKNMKSNSAVNYSWLEDWIYTKEHEDFLRKGVIGDWKNYMSDEMAKQIDDLVANELKDTGIHFYDMPETKLQT